CLGLPEQTSPASPLWSLVFPARQLSNPTTANCRASSPSRDELLTGPVADARYDLADTLSSATQHALSQAPLAGSNATCGPSHGDSRSAELANMAVPRRQ